MELNDKVKEALVITQEECAEVIQSVSKIMRFGFDSCWPTEDSASTKECLEMEVGQLLCMIDILVEMNIINALNVGAAREHKKTKLKTWSSLYK
jgi:hypothetical protein